MFIARHGDIIWFIELAFFHGPWTVEIRSHHFECCMIVDDAIMDGYSAPVLTHKACRPASQVVSPAFSIPTCRRCLQQDSLS